MARRRTSSSSPSKSSTKRREKPKKDASFFHRWLVRFNLLAILLLLITYLASYIDPQKFWFFAFFGLLYPFLLLINLLFILFWLIRRPGRRKYAFLSILAILLGWPILTKTFAFNISDTKQADVAPDLKVMSYNVRNFDLYNWSKNKESRMGMMNIIRSEDPDVICFQEFYTEDGASDFNNLRYLQEEMGYSHHFFSRTLTLRGKDHWGVAIFSKHPITKRGKLDLKNSEHNTVAYVDLNVDDQKVRIFNAHLQSVALGREDIAYVKGLNPNNPQKDKNKNIKSKSNNKKTTEGEDASSVVSEHVKSSSSILRKLKSAYQKRATQSEALANAIKISPYPVVVCSDMNDTPSSYTYATVSKNLQDAFLVKGFGLGGTYVGPLPSFRIDHILLSPELQIHDFEVINEDFSDHYPLVCSVGWGK